MSDQPSQGQQIQQLMAIYFEHYTGDIKPSRPQMAGQLAQILKEVSYERIAPLVRQVAIEGQVVTRNTLIQVARRSVTPPATKMPDKFDRKEMENPKAIPMPDYVKDIIRKGIFRSPEAD